RNALFFKSEARTMRTGAAQAAAINRAAGSSTLALQAARLTGTARCQPLGGLGNRPRASGTLAVHCQELSVVSVCQASTECSSLAASPSAFSHRAAKNTPAGFLLLPPLWATIHSSLWPARRCGTRSTTSTVSQVPSEATCLPFTYSV